MYMYHDYIAILQVRKQVEEKLGRSFTEYKAISYRDQLVSGMNYAIKVNYIAIAISILEKYFNTSKCTVHSYIANIHTLLKA